MEEITSNFPPCWQSCRQRFTRQIFAVRVTRAVTFTLRLSQAHVERAVLRKLRCNLARLFLKRALGVRRSSKLACARLFALRFFTKRDGASARVVECREPFF